MRLCHFIRQQFHIVDKISAAGLFTVLVQRVWVQKQMKKKKFAMNLSLTVFCLSTLKWWAMKTLGTVKATFSVYSSSSAYPDPGHVGGIFSNKAQAALSLATFTHSS